MPKRIHYYNGELLRERDFADEQSYHIDMRRHHNQALHLSGVVYGLTVQAGAKQVTINPGMALSPKGQEIILETQQTIPISVPVSIGVKYKQEQSDPITEMGTTGNSRWTESAEVVTSDDPDAIVLAKVTDVPAAGPVTLDATYQPPRSGPKAMGDVVVEGSLTVKGNLNTHGETIEKTTQKVTGDTDLGDDDNDEVRIHGNLRSTHSTKRMQMASPLSIAGGQWDPTTTEGDLRIGDETHRFKIGVARSGSGAGDVRLRAHGGTNRMILGSGTNDVLIVQSNNVGIGTGPTIREPLDVNGRIAAGALTIGPWPADGRYAFVGSNALNQTQGGNYALLQGVTAEPGRTFLNSPVDIRFRIGNAERMILANNGNIGIGTIDPGDKLDVAGPLRILTGSNPIRFSNVWSGFPDAVTNHAEISNDTGAYKTLMIVGNRSAGLKRRVSVWDRLEVNGLLLGTEGAKFNGVAIGVSPSASGLGQTTFPYAYETIGTADRNHNLRLHSFNSIVFHTGNNQGNTLVLDPAGQWQRSSRETKRNIEDLSRKEALGTLAAMRPVTFYFRDDNSNSRRSGFIAEESPTAIANEDHTMINPMDIIAVLTKVVKEHQAALDLVNEEIRRTSLAEGN